MTFRMSPLALALFVALTQGAALAQTQPPGPTAPPARAAPAAAPVRHDAVEQWLVIRGTTYVPVIDDVTRVLAAGRDAYTQGDTKAAAAKVREAAALLAARADKAAIAERKPIRAAGADLGKLADGISDGRVKTLKAFDAAYAKVLRSDAVLGTMVADESGLLEWTAEPDRHFSASLEALAARDYRRAATEIRKGEAFVGLGAARAGTTTRGALTASAEELNKLAAAVSRGGETNANTLRADFARADHALALAHRDWAAAAWTKKETRTAGGELKAAGREVEHAASWAGGELAAGASAAATDARIVGDKLEAGAVWTRDEVAKAFTVVADAINAIGNRVGSHHRASPFEVGA
jgi:hypothetical protein